MIIGQPGMYSVPGNNIKKRITVVYTFMLGVFLGLKVNEHTANKQKSVGFALQLCAISMKQNIQYYVACDNLIKYNL